MSPLQKKEAVRERDRKANCLIRVDRKSLMRLTVLLVQEKETVARYKHWLYLVNRMQNKININIFHKSSVNVADEDKT